MFRRYPLVKQNDQSDCGAAALATVALFHRRAVGLERARDLAGTDRVGTNLLGVVRAAEAMGFTAKGAKGVYESLSEAPLPAIVHVKTEEGYGHFVVLYHADAKKVIVGDPARGVETISREAFCESWTGYLVLLVPDDTREARRPADAESPTGPWGRFRDLLRPHVGILAEAFVCALLLTALGLSTSFFIRHLVDTVLVHGEWRLLNALGVGMVVLVVFKTLFSLIRHVLLLHVSRKVDLALISSYARHVLRRPMQFFDMRRVGEILSRVSDAAKVRQAVSGAALSTVVDGTLVAITATVMFCYDWHLALASAAFVPFLALTVVVHHPAARKRSREAMEKAARLQSQLVEDISGVEAIKAYGIERDRSDVCDGRLVEVVQAGFSLQVLGLRVTTLSSLIKGLAGISILWYGGQRVIQGELSIGELMFFHTLLGTLLEPLERLAAVNLSLQEAAVAIDRLFQVLDLEVESSDETAGVEFVKLRSGILLRDVTFGYGCRGNVVENLDLEIPAGETVAIVGESGSGKSTLLKLLQRFYDPTEGRIEIDGVDLRDYALGSLRSRIGVVSQEPFIFDGSLLENVTLSRNPTLTEEVLTAVRAAGLEDFVAELPERYETRIGERGANLSGGQRQRLAIARALFRQPEILIFDEATSHLDTATERAIQESLESVLAEKTVVIVAHRLSTVRRADRIYVIEDGRVVESGNHASLLASGGRYAALWHAQTDEGRDAAVVDPPLTGPLNSKRSYSNVS